jgi:hypothetical protein
MLVEGGGEQWWQHQGVVVVVVDIAWVGLAAMGIIKKWHHFLCLIAQM